MPELRKLQTFNGFTDFPLLNNGTANDLIDDCDLDKINLTIPLKAGDFQSRFTDEEGDPKYWGIDPICSCVVACSVAIELDLGAIDWTDGTLSANYTRLNYETIKCDSGFWNASTWATKYMAFQAYSQFCDLGFYVLFGDSLETDVGGNQVGPTTISNGEFTSVVELASIPEWSGGAFDGTFNEGNPLGVWTDGVDETITIDALSVIRPWRGVFSTPSGANSASMSTPEGIFPAGISTP